MKNTKNIFFLFASIVATASSNMQAIPNFELYNKADKAIGVVLGTQKYIVPSMKQLPLTIDTANTIYLEIFPDTKSIAALNMNMMQYAPNKFSINASGKTVYLTWNPAKSTSLYPQTGPLMGLMGKTESGLSLKNNLSSSMIKEQ